MTTITQYVKDIADVTDDTSWVFYVREIRESASGGIVSTRKVRKYPVDGILTVNLDPGPAVVSFNNSTYGFTVPTGSSDLWSLIQASVTIPPGNRHDELVAAVNAWLDTNADLPNKQPLNNDLTAISALTPDDDDLLQRNGGTWTSRTPAQVKADLALSTGDISGLTAAITAAVNGVIAGAPGALDTLNELAAALGDDANFAATVTTALSAKVGLVQAAKNPDLLVTGAVTLDSSDLVTSAAVVWPDSTPGTLTITSRDANNAVLAYNVTYGSPVTQTYTQPAITRNSNGAATNVPAIVVS